MQAGPIGRSSIHAWTEILCNIQLMRAFQDRGRITIADCLSSATSSSLQAAGLLEKCGVILSDSFMSFRIAAPNVLVARTGTLKLQSQVAWRPSDQLALSHRPLRETSVLYSLTQTCLNLKKHTHDSAALSFVAGHRSSHTYFKP